LTIGSRLENIFRDQSYGRSNCHPITIAYMTEDIRSGDLKPDEDEIQKVQFFKWSAFPEDLCERDRQIFQSFIENLISKGRKG